MNYPHLVSLFTISLLSVLVSSANGQEIDVRTSSVTTSYQNIPFLTRRANFKTDLVKKGPSPKVVRELKLLPGVKEVIYPSGELKLKAWVKVPSVRKTKKLPAVVFFHGDLGFVANHFKSTRPFTRAGFVVMAPMLRGENGNPGVFELFYSELDDAANAVKWLAKQSIVDEERIYTFGHSAGGVISALLSLRDDVPIRHGGSSGGLYGPTLFARMQSRVPFNLSDPREGQNRVLAGNVQWMKRKHYAYIGRGDSGVRLGMNFAKKEVKELGNKSQLEIIVHEGRHSSSLAPAVEKYVKLIAAHP